VKQGERRAALLSSPGGARLARPRAPRGGAKGFGKNLENLENLELHGTVELSVEVSPEQTSTETSSRPKPGPDQNLENLEETSSRNPGVLAAFEVFEVFEVLGEPQGKGRDPTSSARLARGFGGRKTALRPQTTSAPLGEQQGGASVSGKRLGR
jgi:hypothetical protein